MLKKIFIFLLLPLLMQGGVLSNLLKQEEVQVAIQKNSNYDYQIAFTAIFRDEAPYIKEWIEYYKLVGVEHFYLYNNLSVDNYLEILTPYIESGEVELTEWPFESTNADNWLPIQEAAYNDALGKAKGKVKWLGVCDLDEFFVPIHADSLPDFLEPYERVMNLGGIHAYWVMFGTSSVEKIPDDKLMIELLTQTASGPNNLFKTILRPERTGTIINPHEAKYSSGFRSHTVDPNAMQINHYWSRDQWFLDHIKKPRRLKWGIGAAACDEWAGLWNHDTKHGIPILRFVPKLRKRMEFE